MFQTMDLFFDTPAIDLLTYGDDNTPVYYWLEAPSDEDSDDNLAFFN